MYTLHLAYRHANGEIEGFTGTGNTKPKKLLPKSSFAAQPTVQPARNAQETP